MGFLIYLVAYLVIGLLFAYGFESDGGTVLTTSFKGTLILLLAWPLIVLFMGPAVSDLKWWEKKVWRRK